MSGSTWLQELCSSARTACLHTEWMGKYDSDVQDESSDVLRAGVSEWLTTAQCAYLVCDVPDPDAGLAPCYELITRDALSGRRGDNSGEHFFAGERREM